MNHFRPSYLRKLVSDLATQVGVESDDAALFARALVDADLRGTSTHGVSRLGIYLTRIEKCLIDPKAKLHIDTHRGGVLAVDAGNGLGQVQATKVLDLLLPLARTNGVAAATIRNSQHFGALSFYCNRAAEQGTILLAMTGCEPAMSPTGGYEPFFGTNPIAVSFPTEHGAPVKIDLATSIVARGNIIAANRKKQPIEEGWALDLHGQPTTDAAQALLGTVQTMAGHKGYALALMVEVFSSVLSGASIGSDIGSMYKDLDRKQNVGHFFCLFDISAFMNPHLFKKRMDATVIKLKSNKRRQGVEEILIPGERSSRLAERSALKGIPLSDETVSDLKQWCTRLGVPFQFDLVEV